MLNGVWSIVSITAFSPAPPNIITPNGRLFFVFYQVSVFFFL